MCEVVLVSAKSCHSKMLWEWRNDPITRQMSLNTEKVSWANHSSWYKKVLLNNAKKLYLGEERGQFFGVVRFDKCDNEEYVYEISVNIAPTSRGKGFGKKLIINGIGRFLTEVDNCKFIRAEVKKLNEPSNKLFKTCGFTVIKDLSEMNIFQLSLLMK